MRALSAIVALLAAAPAFAENTELSLLGGYTTAGSLDERALGIEELEITGGFTWGAALGHFFSDHVGVEASFAQQQSGVAVGTAAGSVELFDMELSLLQGSLVYRFGDADAEVRPFALAGLGATFLSADDLESETKFSFAVGAGIKWFPSPRVGARVQARWAPTLLNDSSDELCDPFGFCQGLLSQFELGGGLVLRF